MDFNKFLGRLDEETANVLREWKGAGAVDSWANIPADVKDALSDAGVSGAQWAYMPEGRDLVILEKGENSWSIFNLKSTIGESRTRRGRTLNEAPRAGSFEIGDLDDEETEGEKMARVAAGGEARTTATAILDGVDFATALKECVEIVKEDAYREK